MQRCAQPFPNPGFASPGWEMLTVLFIPHSGLLEVPVAYPWCFQLILQSSAPLNPPAKAWLWYPAKKLKFGGFLDFSSSPQHGAKAGFGAEPLDMAPAPSLPQMLQESSRIKMYPGHCQPSVVRVEKQVDCSPKTAQIG